MFKVKFEVIRINDIICYIETYFYFSQAGAPFENLIKVNLIYRSGE